MNEFEYKFSLWQFDVVTDFNRTTQLVRNRSTGQLMVKKIMPAYEFEVHNAGLGTAARIDLFEKLPVPFGLELRIQ